MATPTKGEFPINPKKNPAANRGGTSGVSTLGKSGVRGICQVSPSTQDRSKRSEKFSVQYAEALIFQTLSVTLSSSALLV